MNAKASDIYIYFLRTDFVKRIKPLPITPPHPAHNTPDYAHDRAHDQAPDHVPDQASHNRGGSRVRLGQLHIFWPFIRPYRGPLFIAAFSLISVSFILLSLGRGLAWLVDRGLSAGDPALLDRAVLSGIGLAFLVGVGSYMRMAIVNKVAEHVMADIRHAIFAHLLYVPLSWFETARIGDSLSCLNTDTAVIQTSLATSLSMAVRNVILLIGGLVLVILSSPKMSLVVAVIVPLVVVPLIILAKRLRTASHKAQDALGIMSAEAEESFSLIRTVHAFAQEQQMLKQFDGALDKVRAAAMHRVWLRALLSGFVLFIVITAIAVILWIGGRDLLKGQMSAGDLSAFVFYAFIVASATGSLSELGGELQRAAGAADRIAGLLHVPLRQADPPKPQFLDTKTPITLQFHQVHFAYPHYAEKAVLHDISFTALPNQKIAIVGPSGAGKSTLFYMLLRFYDPQSGHISLNHVPITDLRFCDLRRHIALVPQDPVLFSASIASNIAFGRPDADRDLIRQAAMRAHADEFITALPHAYDQQVGEKAIRLSGGQRQRIAIARALLCDPALLLLDEATSALDSVSEHAIQLAMREVMQHRTSLVIAHRLSTVIDADLILVLDQGHLCATGTHESLMATSEIYRQLAAHQFAPPPPPSSPLF